MATKQHIKNKRPDRRDFIKKSTLAGMAAVLGPVSNLMAAPGTPEKQETEKNHSDHGEGTVVTILITTDIHAQLNTHDEFFWENNQAVFRKRGGLATLKTLIESIRKKNPDNTLLYDGGDYFHGSGVASLTEGEALIPLFNKLGYDLMLPGNWEVVYKKKKMLYDMGHANAAKICANMWHDDNDVENGELVYPPYWIKYIGGVKIGFIGYTDHLIPKRQSPAYSVGLKFAHAEVNIARYIKLLREVEGCAVVIIATHMGLAQQVGLANNPATAGADIIMGADTHERVRVPIEGKYARVIECGAFGSFLGKLDLEIKNGQVAGIKYELMDVDPVKSPPDKDLQKMIDTACAPFDKELKTVIGVSHKDLMRYFVLETPMDNMITDAIKYKFKPDIALSNGFRFCQPLALDPKTKTVNITKEFLWNMLPVNSEVKTGKVTGKQVLDWLEKELQNAFAKDPSKRLGGWFVRFSGMEVNFTIDNEMGSRVNQVKVAGQPIDPKMEYSVAACEREGDPIDTICRIEHVKQAQMADVLLHTVVMDYLKDHSPVSPQLEGRATATDAPPTLLTQLKGTTYEFR